MYAKLESEGLIVRRRGSGTYVAEFSKPASKATGIIGLSGKAFRFNGYSPYWAQLQGGAHQAATKAGRQLLILEPTRSQGWEKADGVLICDWNDNLKPRKDLPGLPQVSLMTSIEGIASVTADDYAGMRLATEYLVSLGHRKISYLHGESLSQIVHNRLTAYQDVLKKSGITPDPSWTRFIPGKYDYGVHISKYAALAMSRWLKSGWSTLGCTALLCHNDEAAVGAIQALSEKGIRVPQDISVMGFDGTEYCDLVSPRLSSVEVPLREIGAQAVELLLQQIKADEVSEEHRVFPTRLRIRESTAAPSNE